MTTRDDVREARAISAALNRETLRRICRAKNLPSGGSKHELAVRLAFAGVKAADLTPSQEPTS